MATTTISPERTRSTSAPAGTDGSTRRDGSTRSDRRTRGDGSATPRRR